MQRKAIEWGLLAVSQDGEVSWKVVVNSIVKQNKLGQSKQQTKMNDLFLHGEQPWQHKESGFMKLCHLKICVRQTVLQHAQCATWLLHFPAVSGACCCLPSMDELRDVKGAT